MKRLQKYIGCAIDLKAVGDGKLLSSLGVEGRYVPDEIEEFDEMEFGLGQSGDRTVIFTLVLEHGKLMRMALGYIPPGGDEDNMHAFSEVELAEILAEKGETLVGFFEKITTG